jgi:hypothetical protein
VGVQDHVVAMPYQSVIRRSDIVYSATCRSYPQRYVMTMYQRAPSLSSASKRCTNGINLWSNTAAMQCRYKRLYSDMHLVDEKVCKIQEM